MASRSLGTLTLDVIAKIGGFERGMEKAEREAEKRSKAIAKVVNEAAALGIKAFGGLASAGVAAFAVLNQQADKIAGFQDLADKIGDTAEAVASLKKASDVSGVSMDTVAAASVRLTASLSKSDDEAKGVGAAITALGLSFKEFKALSPVDQIEAVAKAMNDFADGSEKTAVAVALFGKAGADIIPFLNDLADGAERQITLTSDQIKQADEYTKSTARLKSELESFIQLQAAKAIPTLNSVQAALESIAKEQTTVEVATKSVSAAMQAAIIVFQTVAVLGTDVAFVFTTLADTVGGYFAVVSRLIKLDLAGAKEIGRAYREASESRRDALDKFQQQVMSIGQPVYMDSEIQRLINRSNAANSATRPRLNTSGLNTDNNESKLAAEAKSKLQFDLAQIRAASDELINTYSNAERVIDGLRSAGLIEESAYYAEKRRFLQENTQIQIEALEAETARLKQERLNSKEAIDRDREVLKNQQEIAKLRANLATQTVLVDIQEMSRVTREVDDIRKSIQTTLERTAEAAKRYNELVAQGLLTDKERERALDNLAKRIWPETNEEAKEYLQILKDAGATMDTIGNFAAKIPKQTSQEVDALKELIDAQYNLANAMVASRKESGFFTDLQAMRAQSEVYQFRINQLEAYRNTIIAAGTATEAQLLNIAAEIEILMAKVDMVANHIRGIFEDAFADAFESIMNGTKSFGEAMKDAWKQILMEINRIIAREMSQAFMKLLGGGLKPGESQGIFSWIGDILQPGGVAADAGIWTKVLGGGLATGGPALPNRLYEVNENGPEMLEMGGRQYLMMGNQAGRVIPTSQTKMGNTINVNVTAVPGMTRDTALQQGARIGAGIQLAMTRNT